MAVRLGLVPAIFCEDACIMKLLSMGVLFLSDEAWQHLGILSALRSVNSGDQDIHVRCINMLSMT